MDIFIHPPRYNPDFIVSIKTMIAPPKCKVKAVAKQIKMQHAALEGVGVADSKCWFVKLWSSLELFGMEFLSCTNIDTKEKGLIGVSKDKVSVWIGRSSYLLLATFS